MQSHITIRPPSEASTVNDPPNLEQIVQNPIPANPLPPLEIEPHTSLENWWVVCVNLNDIALDRSSIDCRELWVLATDLEEAERRALNFLGAGWVVAWTLSQMSAADLAGHLLCAELSPDEPVIEAPV
jgi:hypothetical protein